LSLTAAVPDGTNNTRWYGMVRLIAEIGSTHDRAKDSCYNAVLKAAEIGIHDVKFQLLDKELETNGNISINPSWLPDLVRTGEKLGINVFASVWSEENMNILKKAGAKTVKFSYSMCRHGWLLKQAVKIFGEVIVSCDVMRASAVKCTRLYCIPLYPVPYEVAFAGLFPLFDGFSDHTLGIGQTLNAVAAGAGIIEKHVYQNEESRTPDRKISISWEEMKTIKESVGGL